MRIGLQILSLKPGQVGGQEVLVRRLLRHLVPFLGDDRLVVFLRPELAAEPRVRETCAHPAVEMVVENPVAHYGQQYADWNLRLIERAALHVVYFPLMFFFPRPLPLPVAVYVPDIQHEHFPEYFPPDQLAWRRERIPESVALANAVITGSQFSARTLRDKLGATHEKLHVIPPGGFPEDEIPATPAALLPGATGRLAKGEFARASARGQSADGQVSDLPMPLGPFILYPAADWPHKNHETLLHALALMAARGRTEQLVLTGILSQRGQTLRGLAAELSLVERVHFLGHVSAEELIDLYRGAELMAFPSRFEGFGLPLVEAMQLGCPIVASKAEAVVETAGQAALLCDDSPQAWADVLATVLGDATLRSDLRHRGYDRARLFDWNRCAIEHLALLRAVGGH